MTTIRDRWYQSEAVKSFNDFCINNEPGRNPLIVMPTGTGKSVVIARIIQHVLKWADNSALVLTHVGELVSQNYGKLKAVWPTAPSGVYCAGLGLKDTKQRVIFGTVQSVAALLKKNPKALGRRNLVIIDECHLLSEKSTSQYRQVLSTLQELAPRMRVLGLSATPYRTKGGMLTKQENAIFTDVAYDLNSQFVRLVDEGYLSPLVTVPTPVAVNLQGVHIRGGDFKEDELIKAVGNEQLLNQACDVMVNEGKERRSWLVFVSGIKNSETVADMLQKRGIKAIDVTSAKTEAQNRKALADFRAGAIRCLVSANQLTTGFDAPNVDLIGMLRPTMSPSLHVQSLGRGTRPAPNKENCLVLDFAQNTNRLGPINAPFIRDPSKKKKVVQERKTEKLCEQCGMLIPITTRICPHCGYQRPQDLDVTDLSNVDLIAYTTSAPTVARSRVGRVMQMICEQHVSKRSRTMMRLTFILAGGAKPFKSFFYLCFDGGIESFKNSCFLWEQFGGQMPPPRNFESCWERRHELVKPVEIEVIKANHVTSHFDKLVKVYYSTNSTGTPVQVDAEPKIFEGKTIEPPITEPNLEGIRDALAQLKSIAANLRA